jgi:hypothetical protein
VKLSFSAERPTSDKCHQKACHRCRGAGVITRRPWTAALLAIATAYGGEASGQTVPPPTSTGASNDALSKESVNPVSRIITIPLRYEADFLDGPYHATKDTFELDQAILPFRLNGAKPWGWLRIR